MRVTGELEEVQNAVYGIVFLATPHNGSSLATSGNIVAKIARVLSPLNPPQVIIETLRRDSKVLFEITEDFNVMASRLEIVSFYETKMTKIGPWRKMVVEQPSAVLNIHNEVRIAQNSDHRDIARFVSLQDRNFRPMLQRLEHFRQSIGNRAPPLRENDPKAQMMRPRTDQPHFEVPFGPCDTFQGRKDILHELGVYFHTQTLLTLAQRIFAICGLGGCGKTQTALKFADSYRHKYTTGVFFLTAQSEASLQADISNICENLHLDLIQSPGQAFRRWLSLEEHKHWLLILDNADKLETLQSSECVPKTPWGHIIITSRDQTAIGTVAPEGHVLRDLEVDEAVSALLLKAGFTKPSSSDCIDAQEIVKMLGGLALAVDQAGAYIRARRKSMATFLRICRDRQNDILEYKPRFSEYDKTIFTTWDMNFEQVEHESQDASNLLLLLCYLDPTNIPETMLDRACSPQKRWNYSGEMIEIEPMLVNVDIVQLIRDEVRFDDAIEILLSFSLVRLDNDENGLRHFSVHPLVQHCASQRVAPTIQDDWRLQAIAIVCHAFPRNVYLEPLFHVIARSQLPHVVRIVREFSALPVSRTNSDVLKSELTEVMLAASRFDPSSWKRETIELAKVLSKDVQDPYLHICVAQRESSVLRIMGKGVDSRLALEKFVNTIILPGEDKPIKHDARWNARRGELVHSFAENLIQQGSLEHAERELLEWTPIQLDSPSSMERIIVRSKSISLGRILRMRGCFREALDLLLATLQESEADDTESGGWRKVLLSNIADLYCELGQPWLAQQVLIPELEKMRFTGSHDTSAGRRLQLALAESYVKNEENDKAGKALDAMNVLLESIEDPDVIAKRAKFRVWSSLARRAHATSRWDEAMTAWERAGELLEALGRRTGSQPGLVHLGRAYALLQQGNAQQSLKEAKIGRELLEREGERRYWIVGLDSYWRDHIVNVTDKASFLPGRES